MKPILEVCVDSLASARNAIRGGADRLELCSALAVGGLTPYAALLKQIRAESDIPIRCLMRPRAGDFLYTYEEISMMAEQMLNLRDLGADGFVIGCLDAEGNLDAKAMAPLLEAAQGKPLTLHRCIDVSRSLEETYRAAGKLGFDTVLTSGGCGNCVDGMENIGKLLHLHKMEGGPRVLIGAGVNDRVIRRFLEVFPGVDAFHASCKADVPSRMVYRREGVPMGLPGFDEWVISETSEDKVAFAKAALMSVNL